MNELIIREQATETFLKENYPTITKDQKHLDGGSEARGYWHYGYLMALKDILRLITRSN